MKTLGISALAFLVIGLSLGRSASAGPYVILGPSDNFAVDQPRAYVEVVDGTSSLGPADYTNIFLLDTGAQGLIAVSYAATDLLNNGYDDTAAVYDELGVAGTTPYNISAEYDFRFTGSSGTPINTLSDVRIMSSESANFGGFTGIVGIPAMLDRVTTLDMAAMKGTGLGELTLEDLMNTDLSIGFMGVSFADQLPTDPGHRYSVPLTLVEFPHTGQRDPNDPLPTYGPLPFANVQTGHGTTSASGQFLVDTGAQLSIISTQTAISLGMDQDSSGAIDGDEVLMWTEIGGVGGSMSVPIVAMDSLALGTDQGVDLIWTDLAVVVLDIAAEPGADPLAGIFGCDLLTSGWTAAIFGASGGIDGALLDLLESPEYADVADLLNQLLLDLLMGEELDPRTLEEIDLAGLNFLDFLEPAGETPESGYMQQVHFDFNNSGQMSGAMVFDVAGEYDNVIPEPATICLLVIGATSLLNRRRTF